MQTKFSKQSATSLRSGATSLRSGTMATKRKRSEKKDRAPPAKKPAINKVAADYPVRHGERGCEKKGCSNGAYWLVGHEHLCGVHSKKNMPCHAWHCVP